MFRSIKRPSTVEIASSTNHMARHHSLAKLGCMPIKRRIQLHQLHTGRMCVHPESAATVHSSTVTLPGLDCILVELADMHVRIHHRAFQVAW
jgi:hypothetical protein